MTKLNTVLNVILLALVAWLMYDRFNVPRTAVEEIESVDSTAVEMPALIRTGRIGYIDIDSLNANYRLLEDNLKELETAQRNTDRRIENKMRRAQEKIEAYRQSIKTEEEYMRAQEDLANMEVEIEQYREAQTRDLLNTEQRMQRNLYQRIENFLKEYNSENGFDYVIGYQLGGQVLYTDSTLEITEDVISGLNTLYINELAEDKEQETE